MSQSLFVRLSPSFHYMLGIYVCVTKIRKSLTYTHKYIGATALRESKMKSMTNSLRYCHVLRWLNFVSDYTQWVRQFICPIIRIENSEKKISIYRIKYTFWYTHTRTRTHKHIIMYGKYHDHNQLILHMLTIAETHNKYIAYMNIASHVVGWLPSFSLKHFIHSSVAHSNTHSRFHCSILREADLALSFRSHTHSFAFRANKQIQNRRKRITEELCHTHRS